MPQTHIYKRLFSCLSIVIFIKKEWQIHFYKIILHLSFPVKYMVYLIMNIDFPSACQNSGKILISSHQPWISTSPFNLNFQREVQSCEAWQELLCTQTCKEKRDMPVLISVSVFCLCTSISQISNPYYSTEQKNSGSLCECFHFLSIKTCSNLLWLNIK